MNLYFMVMLAVSVLVVFILWYRNVINPKKFFIENDRYFQFLREKDFDFLVRVKYGDTIQPNAIFQKRLRNGFITILVALLAFLTQMSFLYAIISIVLGYIVFKTGYTSLKGYYKNRMNEIDLTLPYYLKNLEILVQHYTVPVALATSIEEAPAIFKEGLRELIEKVNAGDSSIEPYMEFAREYSVRDSMRMMRLLYRLGLGSEENKQEQIIIFSKTVSSLQNKAREQKYKERLSKMENRTMLMLAVTGGATMFVLLMSMMQMMSI